MRYVRTFLAVATFLLFWYFSSFFTGCSDGWGSSSIGLRGACSYHGGVSKIPIIIIFFGFIASLFVFFISFNSGSDTRENNISFFESENKDVSSTKNTYKNDKIESKRELSVSIENYNDKKFSKIFIYSDGLMIKEFHGGKNYKVKTQRVNVNIILKINSIINEGSVSAVNSTIDGEIKGYLVRLFENHAYESNDYFFDRTEQKSFLDLKELINSF